MELGCGSNIGAVLNCICLKNEALRTELMWEPESLASLAQQALTCVMTSLKTQVAEFSRKLNLIVWQSEMGSLITFLR